MKGRKKKVACTSRDDVHRTGTVHIIDDDADLRDSLQMVIESASLPAFSYSSAEDFFVRVDLQRPGAIVLDLRLPGLGGMALLQRLNGTRNDMPVIVITGHVDVPTAVRGVKIGAVDVLH